MDKDTKTSNGSNDQQNIDETKLQTLRSLIQEGIDSGEVEYSYDGLMKEMDGEF
ncbi:MULTISPECIES: type II toxin-antitoxin system ParD family antitoxin [unclassified Marinomonas]|uniref:type II toxin-antitoxin system ParD family antitoxin n=1 Tax=unclassified Marinomonas TaxID=196814 RepID=UPI0018E16594|nr:MULTISPECIES: hypothetical protein [unclassified Marinomonas]